MHIHQHVFENGERYPVLMDATGVPDFWVTLFVTEQLRPKMTQNAVISKIRHLIHFKLWEEQSGRDLVAELGANDLHVADAIELRDFCRLETLAVRKAAPPHINGLGQLSNPSRLKLLNTVNPSHTHSRLSTIANFIEYTAIMRFRRRDDFRDIQQRAIAFSARVIKQRPKNLRRKSTLDTAHKAPSPEKFDALMARVHPDHPDNPFTESVRFRNFLIFQVLYHGGFRAGEILALRVEDIKVQQGRIAIVRRHDSKDDPRARQPVPKTLGRDVPFDRDLLLQLDQYIMGERAQKTAAGKHPFVFVTHKKGEHCGKPLSESGFFRSVLKAAVSSDQELFSEITRHGFRHNFNYRLSQMFDKINALAKQGDSNVRAISEKEQSDIRQRLNGWSSKDTAAIYNQRFIHEMADKFMLADMQGILDAMEKKI